MKKGFVALVFIFIFFTSFVDNEFKISKSLDIFFNLFKEVNYNYVDDVDPEKMIKSAIDGMLKSLDPYTTFIPESELEDFRFQTTGQYGGIGALIRKLDDYVVIAEPYKNSPAAKAGLKAGDKIVEVDGKNALRKDVSDVSESLKGTPGTTVEVLIERPGVEKPLKIKILREKITIPNVPYYGIIHDSIGYIRLTNFTTDAGKEVAEATNSLKKRHARYIILDLRNNPGGLLSEAVEVVNCFIPANQLVVFTKGKIKEACKQYFTVNDPVDTIIPLAVLVNRGTASAAEIVAGSLQDLDRAIIIGQRTFGKGLVQSTRPLSYNTQLKVTTAKYYIPSGRCIQAVDYSHRNEDGSVGYIPDSLIKEFHTKVGRKVYDGGGIVPDIKTNYERLSDLAFNLYTKNYIFNYATLFVQKNNSIPLPEKFQINDYIYNDFIDFLKNKDFDYKTKTEEHFNNLVNIAQKEKYFDIAENEFKALKDKIKHDKQKDLITFRPEIEKIIADEIIGRYYFQEGKIRYNIAYDKEIDTTIQVLCNKTKYLNILSGKENNVSQKDYSNENSDSEFDE